MLSYIPELDVMLRLMYDARRFFKNTRYIHGMMALILLCTGVASLILSIGSDGTAKVPYFFSAFVAAVWVRVIFVTLTAISNFP